MPLHRDGAGDERGVAGPLCRQPAAGGAAGPLFHPPRQKKSSNALIGTSKAHGKMSTQALNSDKLRLGLLDILLGPARLDEELRRQDGGQPA